MSLLERNRVWAAAKRDQDPNYFPDLAKFQTPQYLWIGCSDSRVSENVIVDLPAGEIFAHRNIANVVIHTDFNCLSVIEYAVEVLQVSDIVVCGHHGCGGIQAALNNTQMGLIDNWLRHIKDVYAKHERHLNTIRDNNERLNRLSELNVIEQVSNVCHTTIVQNAWNTGRYLKVHGLVYSLADGLLKDLNVNISSNAEIEEIYRVSQTDK